MARVRFTHSQPSITREDERSRRRRRLRLERRRCRPQLERMRFLPCGFNRRRHSPQATAHVTQPGSHTWRVGHPGSRTRLATRHAAVEASSLFAIDDAAGGTPSPIARWRRRRRRRRRVVWICGARGRRLVESYVCAREATRRRPWGSRRDQLDEFHHVVRVAFQRASDDGIRRPSHWLSASSRATVARLASAANVSLRHARWQPGVLGRVPRVAASEPGRACVKTCTALVSVFPKIFVLDLGTGTSPLSDYVKSEKLESVWVVITVDKDPKRKPSVCENIFRWPHWLASLERRTCHEHSSFTGWDWIHFSPDCREFSSSKTIGDRDIDGALLLVHAGLALIASRRPRVWTVESSAHGPCALQAQPCMRALDDVMLPHAIHFCQSLGLGNWKPGRWWTNMPFESVEPLLSLTCTNAMRCCFCATFGKHRLTSQGGKSATGAL